MLFDIEERRVPISAATKRKVYQRAKRRCESCGIPLKMKNGEFHHTRKPTVKSRASTIQFLCPTCHKKYGHKHKTTTKSTILGTEKVTKIHRKRVRKHPSSPYWKEKPRKKTAKTKQRRKRKATKSKTTKRRKRRKKRIINMGLS